MEGPPEAGAGAHNAVRGTCPLQVLLLGIRSGDSRRHGCHSCPDVGTHHGLWVPGSSGFGGGRRSRHRTVRDDRTGGGGGQKQRTEDVRERWGLKTL